MPLLEVKTVPRTNLHECSKRRSGPALVYFPESGPVRLTRPSQGAQTSVSIVGVRCSGCSLDWENHENQVAISDLTAGTLDNH